MKELIKITEKEGVNLVSARELYELLNVKTPFRKWIERRVIESPYFIEKEDYIKADNFVLPSGQRGIEYALTIDTAKKVSMVEKSQKGEDVRNYFIECEKQLKQQHQIPQTYSEALMLAAKQAEQIELHKIELKELAPKGEFYDQVTGSTDTIDIGKVAKVINIGIGRNTLFSRLRDMKILQDNNIPYQQYIDRGYFRLIETKYHKPDGSTHISLKTVVYQKGVDYIIKKMK